MPNPTRTRKKRERESWKERKDPLKSGETRGTRKGVWGEKGTGSKTLLTRVLGPPEMVLFAACVVWAR